MEADQFFDLLSGVARGEAAMSHDLATRVLAAFAVQAERSETATEVKEDTDALTLGQTEVLQTVAQGLTNKEIVASLAITECTVKYHLSEILKKLHLQNRGQVILYVMRTGLASDGNFASE